MIKLALSVSKAEPKSKTEGMKVTEFKRADFEFDKPEEYIKKLFTTRLYSTNYWLDGRCSQKNFLGLYGVTLDVDAGLSLIEARELFKEYNYIIHTSTSHRADKGNSGVQDRFRVILPFDTSHYNDYDLIVFSRTYGEPHMFTLFFLTWSPAEYQTDRNLDRFEANRWIWVLKFDKFYFPDLGDSGTRYQDIVKANPGKKILFIGRKEDFPANLSRLVTIDFLNGTPAFDIVQSGSR